MSDERILAERIDGSEQIINYCMQIADGLGIQLERVYWSTDITVDHDQYVLVIIADTGSVEISLSKVEIEDYQGKVGTAVTEVKIRAALHGIQS